jgi:7TMR-DISM extracellular 2
VIGLGVQIMQVLRPYAAIFSRWILLLLGVMPSAWAAPTLDWGDRVQPFANQGHSAGVSVDLRERWEATRVGAVQLPNATALDPAQVWSWPRERFQSEDLRRPLQLYEGERLVARFTVFSEQVGTDFSVSFLQPRLDAVHVSYRYDNGPWMTLSAGDTLPMERWAQPDRSPSFNLPLLAGQMDIVVQVAHRGVLEMPVVLQNKRAFLQDRSRSIWVAGMMVGISGVMALMPVCSSAPTVRG